MHSSLSLTLVSLDLIKALKVIDGSETAKYSVFFDDYIA